MCLPKAVYGYCHRKLPPLIYCSEAQAKPRLGTASNPAAYFAVIKDSEFGFTNDTISLPSSWEKGRRKQGAPSPLEPALRPPTPPNGPCNLSAPTTQRPALASGHRLLTCRNRNGGLRSRSIGRPTPTAPTARRSLENRVALWCMVQGRHATGQLAADRARMGRLVGLDFVEIQLLPIWIAEVRWISELMRRDVGEGDWRMIRMSGGMR